MTDLQQTKDDRWLAKKQYYQSESIVEHYDERRFVHPRHRRVTARKWAMILEAFGEHFGDIQTVLDVPCGTGRFTRQLLDAGKRVLNGDISHPMLATAAARVAGASTGLMGGVRFEAERLPFADDSVDAVLSIRFLFHVPRQLRPAMLREFARVSRRWVVVDVRHRYCLNTLVKDVRARLRGRRAPRSRYAMAELREDIVAGGLVLRRMIWNYPPFSEKLVLLCEKRRTV